MTNEAPKFLDYSEGEFYIVKPDALKMQIDRLLRESLLPELEGSKEKLAKFIKNRENAVSVMIALQRPEDDQTEDTLYVQACLTKITKLERRIEDLTRFMKNAPESRYGIKLTNKQLKEYGA